MYDETLNLEPLWEEQLNNQPKISGLKPDVNDKCVTTGGIRNESENKVSNGIILKMGKIYLITNNVTGGKYIGQTIQSLNQRWLDHQRNASNKIYRSPLYSSIRKHGIDNFSIACIETVSDSNVASLAIRMNEREIHFIKIHKTFISDHSTNGYNLTTGGGNCRFSEESKKKMSATHKNRWNDERRHDQSRRSLDLWKTEQYRKVHRESMQSVVTDGFRKKMSDISKEMWTNVDFKDKMSKLRKQLYLDNESVRNNLIRIGNRNGRYDSTVYDFENSKTGEIHRGTQFEFSQCFDHKKAARSAINGLVRGRNEQYRGWKLK